MLRETGWGRICTRSIGAPTWASAALITSTVALVLVQLLGEGAMMMALAPLIAIMALLTGVAVGLVEGVMAEAAGRSLEDLTQERDQLLVSLLEMLARERGKS